MLAQEIITVEILGPNGEQKEKMRKVLSWPSNKELDGLELNQKPTARLNQKRKGETDDCR